MLPLKKLFDCMTTAVLVFDHEQRCVHVNEACQAMLLKSRRALLGSGLVDILGEHSEILDQCQQAAINSQHTVLREVRIYVPEWQQELLLDLTITPCDLDAEGMLMLELIDRKEAHKLSHDNDMLARFKVGTQIVRGLAHEIKNPLGGIRGAAQLLALESNNQETMEYCAVITREVDRLSDLLGRMSGGRTSLTRSRVDIHEPLTHIASLLKAEHGEELELIYNFDTSLPMLDIHFDQVKQALLNLIQNAVQWSMIECEPDAKRQPAMITISTRAAYPDIMRSLMPQQGIRVRIQDNGPGVDLSITEQLFLPMVSRREGGTGLGLSISQEIAQNNGGFIKLDEPTTQAGASFSLYLPFHAQEEGI